MKLCSAYDEFTQLTCDLPEGHKGPHKATVLWGDEGVDDQ
jgi:hypothetical protein